MKTTLSLIIVALMFFSADLRGQAKVKDKTLANKVFKVEIKIEDKHEDHLPKFKEDEITFKSGKLNSKFINKKHKFLPAAYTVTIDSSSAPMKYGVRTFGQTEKRIVFEATGKNPSGEQIKWEGTVTGEDIDGTVIISLKGKVVKEYSFSGFLKIHEEHKK